MQSDIGLIAWGHKGGICKLIRIDRADIDDGSDEPDAWDLLWIDPGNVRRTEIRLDCAYARATSLPLSDRHEIAGLMRSAPQKARNILRPFAPHRAASALGRKGGLAGRGESQRRGDADHYREMARRSAEVRKK